jgi:hypothetical protein
LVEINSEPPFFMVLGEFACNRADAGTDSARQQKWGSEQPDEGADTEADERSAIDLACTGFFHSDLAFGVLAHDDRTLDREVILASVTPPSGRRGRRQQRHCRCTGLRTGSGRHLMTLVYAL